MRKKIFMAMIILMVLSGFIAMAAIVFGNGGIKQIGNYCFFVSALSLIVILFMSGKEIGDNNINPEP